MTLQQLRALFRFRNPDLKATKISNTNLLIELNNGAIDIARLTKCVPNVRSLSIGQYQFKYDLNEYVLGINNEGGIWYWETTNGRQLDPKTIDYWDSLYQTWHDASPNKSWEYVLKGKQIWLRPNPDVAAYTTTLNGAINSTVTEMTLTTATYFPARFRCLIGSEVIEVQYHTGGACYSLVRGVEGTTAASHSSGATITMRNLLMFTFEKPVTMSANGDDPFNDLTYLVPYHELIIKYATWKIKPVVNKDYDAAKGEVEYMQDIEKMKREIRTIPDIRHTKLRMRSYFEHFKDNF